MPRRSSTRGRQRPADDEAEELEAAEDEADELDEEATNEPSRLAQCRERGRESVAMLVFGLCALLLLGSYVPRGGLPTETSGGSGDPTVVVLLRCEPRCEGHERGWAAKCADEAW